jgi:hypothetical protein
VIGARPVPQDAPQRPCRLEPARRPKSPALPYSLRSSVAGGALAAVAPATGRRAVWRLDEGRSLHSRATSTARTPCSLARSTRVRAPQPLASALAIARWRLRTSASWDPASPPTAPGAAPFPLSSCRTPGSVPPQGTPCAALGLAPWPPTCLASHRGFPHHFVHTADPFVLVRSPKSLGELPLQADAWVGASAPPWRWRRARSACQRPGAPLLGRVPGVVVCGCAGMRTSVAGTARAA